MNEFDIAYANLMPEAEKRVLQCAIRWAATDSCTPSGDDANDDLVNAVEALVFIRREQR